MIISGELEQQYLLCISQCFNFLTPWLALKKSLQYRCQISVLKLTNFERSVLSLYKNLHLVNCFIGSCHSHKDKKFLKDGALFQRGLINSLISKIKKWYTLIPPTPNPSHWHSDLNLIKVGTYYLGRGFFPNSKIKIFLYHPLPSFTHRSKFGKWLHLFVRIH